MKAIGEAINNFGHTIVVLIFQVVYGIWRMGAWLVNLLEVVFKKFVGLDNDNISIGVKDADDGAITDVTTMIINNRSVQSIFKNLVAFAVIMLIFFTILQIIREHYKDKNGGNPYILVFRMVKAMALFMFVTAACIVGLDLSGSVLKALNDATRGAETNISGVIFGAMAANGNRVTLALDSPSSGELDGTGTLNATYAAIIAETRDKKWMWNTYNGDLPDLYYGGDPVNPITKKVEINGVSDDVEENSTVGTWVHGIQDGLFERLDESGKKVGVGYVVKFDLSNLFMVVDRYGSDKEKIITDENGNVGEDFQKHDPDGKNYMLPIWAKAEDGKAKLVPRHWTNTKWSNYHKGFHPLNMFKAGGGKKDTNPYLDDAHNTDKTGTCHYYIMLVDEQTGKPDSSTMREFGMMQSAYFHVKDDTNTLFQYYGANLETGQDAKSLDDYAVWIDNKMKRSGDVYEVLYKMQDGKDISYGPMTYTNPDAVNQMYDMAQFNWIIGFGGLFVALGVLNSFAFGMIQRIAELGVLYMFSPVTLAFFPFDDGAQFNNAFVKPFYKKVIASYAPVISLNIFFVVLPAFDSVTWFPDNRLFNFTTSCIVSIALLSMLPKVRTSIQTMLGADPMEDKKLVGKNSVFGDTKKFVEGLQMYGSNMRLDAKNRLEAGRERKKKRMADRVALHEQGNALGLDLDPNKLRNKWFWGAARRQAVRAANREKQLGTELGRQRNADGSAVKNTFANRRKQQIREAINRKSNQDKRMDDAIGIGKDDIDNGYLADKSARAINNDANLRKKGWYELGRARGMSEEDAKKFAEDHKNDEFKQEHFQEARKKGRLRTGIEKLQEKYNKQQREAFNNARKSEDWDRTLANALNDSKDKDIEKRRIAYKKRLGKELDDRLDHRDIAKYRKMGIIDDDLQQRLFNEANPAKVANQKEVDRARRSQSILAWKTKRQKNLDDIGFRNAFDRGLFNTLNPKDSEEFFEKDKDGKWQLKDKDGLEEAYYDLIKDKKKGKMIREALGVQSVFSGERNRDIAMGALKKGADVVSTLFSPWKATDALYSGLSHLRDKHSVFGAIAQTLFDPDNGMFFKTGIGKMIDGFSYSKVFKSLDQLEKTRKERTSDEAYALARTYRFAGAFADNAQEYVEREERERFYKDKLGTDEETGKKKFAEMKANAEEAQKSIFDLMVSSVDTSKIKGGRNPFLQLFKKYMGDLTTDSDSGKEHAKGFYRLMNTGSKEDIIKLCDGKEDRAMAIWHLREKGVFENEEKKKKIDKQREIIKDYEKAEGMCQKAGEKGLEWRSYQEEVKDNDKRRAQLDEYMAGGMRILGISEADKQELKRIRQELLDENGKYITVKRKYELGAKEVEYNGEIIDVSSAEAFGAFQKKEMSVYEKAVKSKVDIHGVAFRDYGEKTGDRMDGILGATMASEQVKLMQDVIWKCDRHAHQLFRDPAFVEMLEGSKWQTMADQFLKASRGEENVFDKSLLRDIKNKSQLADIGNMFKNMMGDASGEMRGGGFAVANNVIAKTFRMAFVDQIDEALKVTASMMDNEQMSAFGQRDSNLNEIAGLQNSPGWRKDLFAPFKERLALIANEEIMDGKALTKLQKDMLEHFDKVTEENRIDKNSHAAEEMNRLMRSVISNELKNRQYRNETNLINWRRRILREMDHMARNANARKGDPRQAIDWQSMDWSDW